MSPHLKNVKITQVQWLEAEKQLSKVRTVVFIDEQYVPVNLEWDDLDATAQHLLAVNDANEPIACARILNNGSIGRMAVLKAWRGLGVGSALLKRAIEIHQQHGTQNITLSAQVHAITFYEKAGFEVISQPYLDANIQHVDMRLLVVKNEY
jgi:predicted GNAT family N-acyltransferase